VARVRPDALGALLNRQPVLILDGGLATELEAQGCNLDDPLWSARVLVEAPDEIRDLHREYLEAGADCIVTASYQASIAGFGERGMDRAEASTTLLSSVRLAQEAREEFWSVPENRRGRRQPLIAASIGPYGAFLADGSEYTGDYDLDAAGLEEFHRERLRLLADSGADLLACESIPSRIEAGVLVRLLDETHDARAWISFTCRDAEHLSDGTEIDRVAEEVASSPRVVAVGVNCTAPRNLSGIIARIRAATDKPIVAYPNSGEIWDSPSRSWRPGEESLDLAFAAPSWVELGARVIGGCCRIGPNDIRRLRRRLLSATP